MRLSPLDEEHRKLGASFTDFGGWQMPVRYSSDLEEHHAVRNSAGLFDISHMGEIFVRGHDAARFLDFALVGLASEIKIGRAKYALICNLNAGIIDDLIIYRLAAEEFLIISNASNYLRVAQELSERTAGFDAEVADESSAWALIAVQGPKATAIIQKGSDIDLAPLPYYSIARGTLGSVPCFFARTGYTGEDGFEIMTPSKRAAEIWVQLMSHGGSDLTACGLASRDTLRLEAGMPLYGQELSESLTPFDVGLGRVVRLDIGREFYGREALEQAAKSPARVLVGLAGEGRRAARSHYTVLLSGENVGEVTSGALSPTLGHPIAMASVSTANPGLWPTGKPEVGDLVVVDVRGSEQEFEVVKLPFYKRS